MYRHRWLIKAGILSKKKKLYNYEPFPFELNIQYNSHDIRKFSPSICSQRYLVIEITNQSENLVLAVLMSFKKIPLTAQRFEEKQSISMCSYKTSHIKQAR